MDRGESDNKRGIYCNASFLIPSQKFSEEGRAFHIATQEVLQALSSSTEHPLAAFVR
jgi:hypothetical protein